MAQNLKNLNLAMGSIELGGPGRRQGLIVRDVQTIHDPTVSPVAYLRQRREMVGDILELYETRTGNACGIFSVRLTLIEHEKVQAWFDLPQRAEHAAGWAALHLMESLARDTSSVSEIHAIDPMEATAQTSIARIVEKLDDVDIASLTEPVTSAGADVTFLPVSLGKDIGTGTKVTFTNNRALSLPDALDRIKQGYDELYPGIEAETSAAVAGIVGAQSVEAFSAAWHSAAEQHNPKWPAAAPRLLLESDAFLFNQA